MTIEQYTRLINDIVDYSNSLDLYISGKIKQKQSLSCRITQGNLSSLTNTKEIGIGFHLFNKKGYSTFISTYEFDKEKIKKLISQGASILTSYSNLYNESNTNIFDLPKINARLSKKPSVDFDSISPDQYQKSLLNLYKQLPKHESLTYQYTSISKDNETLLFRSDGTQILYNDFHSAIIGTISQAVNGKASCSLKSHIFDTSLFNNQDKIDEIIMATEKYNTMVPLIAAADMIDRGNYNIIIDYALAKGLAHEAFGHAAETDFIENSILGNKGKFNTGLQVAQNFVSITDESFSDEWAYAPFSDHGIPREKAEIVKNGILNQGLSDVFSYKKAGTPLAGSARSESYFHIPVPRMSNIRIELDPSVVSNPGQFNTQFNSIDPTNVLDFTLQENLFGNNKPVVLLSGYTGGQVDPVKGNYVFNCQAIYSKEKNKINIYKPSIFSGKTLETLSSIDFGIGGLKLDAIGTCGKAGQGVHSSGGSHYYIGIQQNNNIVIGGK